MTHVKTGFALLFLVVAQCSIAVELEKAPAGRSDFDFSSWSGPKINVRLYVPEELTDSTPVVIVMHGASRDVDRYFDDWSAQAKLHGFVVVVPEFTVEDFKGSARYNLGHVFDAETGLRRAEESWTFSVIEPLFDHVVALLNGNQKRYTLYGHSAGSQFVHRFLYYKPEARVERVIAANAGWYTLPVYGVEYPYGLDQSGVKEEVLARVFAKDVILLLGDADIDPNDENLRKTVEAKRQGRNRYERGIMMYGVAEAQAKKLGVEFNWTLLKVPGAGHSDAQMAPAAADAVTAQPARAPNVL